MKNLLSMSLLAAALAPAISAQVIVNEQFNYASQAELAANWTMGTAPLTLVTDDGFTAPSVRHAGTTTGANRWATPFALTPTDAAPVRLTADLYNETAGNTVTTVGLRQNGGTSPLFEMGFYRVFDNQQTGTETTSILSPSGAGVGVRTIAIGQDLNGQDWVRMSPYIQDEWLRFEATFDFDTVTVRIDRGIDGTWDFEYREVGTTAIGTFGDLRIHSPATTAAGTTALVDNIRLEVVPEPTAAALLSLGALALLRRRK